ncbi:MAG TPA: methylated-DNA--[protein]-cysteine S-methyltransferase [Candidatus Saccharimonadales bacterium]|nr:methylated-DNA--[protein]-cysteine S-methyltransferase [Candidatus Saccharimonadales bacterium]
MTNRVHAAWLTQPGPWGPIQLAATDRGLAGLSILATPEAFADEMARHADLVVDATRARTTNAQRRVLDSARRQLDEYLGGRHRSFELVLDLRVRSAWDRLVLTGVLAIPHGSTAGYGELARRIGRVGAARAVGGAVRRNPIGIVIPCHRVIAGDGSLGGYGGDWSGTREVRLGIKRWLLELEGAEHEEFTRTDREPSAGALESSAHEPSIAR